MFNFAIFNLFLTNFFAWAKSTEEEQTIGEPTYRQKKYFYCFFRLIIRE